MEGGFGVIGRDLEGGGWGDLGGFEGICEKAVESREGVGGIWRGWGLGESGAV